MTNLFEFSARQPDRLTNPYFGYQATVALRAVGVNLPAPVADAQRLAEALEKRAERPADLDTLTGTVLDALAGDPSADVDAQVLAMVAAEVTDRAVKMAANRARIAHRRAVIDHGDEMIESAKPLFAARLAEVVAVADYPTLDLGKLAEQEAAKKVIAVGAAMRAVAHLDRFRQAARTVFSLARPDRFTRGPGNALRLWRSIEYRNPDKATFHGGDLSGLLANIAAGAEPWYPTVAEMDARDAELDAVAAELAAAEARKAAIQRW